MGVITFAIAAALYRRYPNNPAATMFSGILKRIIPQNQGQDEIPFGFQVLRNPNPELPIEPWFDFIIELNNRRIVGCLHY